jgi:DNA-binding protein HU-beta
MTKADIINNIAEKTGLPKKDIAIAVEAFMGEIRDCIAKDREPVFLRGFGTFTIKHRAKKTARNISRNVTMIIDAHDIPSFKPAKSFVEKMQ